MRCVIIPGSDMRGFRARLLLVVLLTTPVGVFATTVISAVQPCCDYSMSCPLHHNQSQQGKNSCQGADQSPQMSVCDPGQQVHPAIPQFSLKAIGPVEQVALLPVVAAEVNPFDTGSTLTRFVAPPEQPPRP